MAIGPGANVGYAYRSGTLDQDESLANGFPPALDWSSNGLPVGLSLVTSTASSTATIFDGLAV
jgi:hypothetical protein